MNLTLLHQLCKKYARQCYEDALHSYNYAPFDTPPSIDVVISFEVNQKFGGKVLEKITKDFTPSLAQWKYASKVIEAYKRSIVKKIRENLNSELVN